MTPRLALLTLSKHSAVHVINAALLRRSTPFPRTSGVRRRRCWPIVVRPPRGSAAVGQPRAVQPGTAPRWKRLERRARRREKQMDRGSPLQCSVRICAGAELQSRSSMVAAEVGSGKRVHHGSGGSVVYHIMDNGHVPPIVREIGEQVQAH